MEFTFTKRNLQSLGLQDWYLEPENSLLVKTIQALAFVPPDDVIEAFQQLTDSLDADTDETLSDFLAYFESTWLGIVQRGRRRRHNSTSPCGTSTIVWETNLPRTNNSVEGWHRAFDQRMSVTQVMQGAGKHRACDRTACHGRQDAKKQAVRSSQHTTASAC